MYMYISLASLVVQRLKRLPTTQHSWVLSLGREHTLEKEMATHSSILAGRFPWMEERGRLQSTGSQRVGHNWATSPSPSASLTTLKPLTVWMTTNWGKFLKRGEYQTTLPASTCNAQLGESQAGINISQRKSNSIRCADCCCSVTKSYQTLCDTRHCSTPVLCPSLSPRDHSDSCPLSRWCYLTISSSAAPFSFCLQPFPTWGSFPMSQLFR